MELKCIVGGRAGSALLMFCGLQGTDNIDPARRSPMSLADTQQAGRPAAVTLRTSPLCISRPCCVQDGTSPGTIQGFLLVIQVLLELQYSSVSCVGLPLHSSLGLNMDDPPYAADGAAA